MESLNPEFSPYGIKNKCARIETIFFKYILKKKKWWGGGILYFRLVYFYTQN